MSESSSASSMSAASASGVDSALGITSSATSHAAAAAAICAICSTLRRAALGALSAGLACASGTPRCTTSSRTAADAPRRARLPVSATAAARTPASSLDAMENGRAPIGRSASRRTIGACIECRRRPRVGEPLGERVDRGGVAVVEVRASGEELDRRRTREPRSSTRCSRSSACSWNEVRRDAESCRATGMRERARRSGLTGYRSRRPGRRAARPGCRREARVAARLLRTYASVRGMYCM